MSTDVSNTKKPCNIDIVRRSCFNCKNLIKDSKTTPVNAICKYKCFCGYETTLEELKEPVHCLLHNYA